MWNLCPGLASETVCQCLEILGTDIKKSAHNKHGPPFGEDCALETKQLIT